jgi:hypothetical protein
VRRGILLALALVVVCGGAVMAAGPGARTRTTWEHLASDSGAIPKADVGPQAASLVLDIDKDGIDDFLVAGWGDISMVWMRRTGSGWETYLVDNRKSHIEAGGAFADIDGDGDLDILQGGSWATNEVWWWENPYPDYETDKPWPRHIIKDSGAKQHHDQIFGDFDGDGKLELAFWNQNANALIVADVPADPKVKENWNLVKVWGWKEGPKCEGLAKADIDLDGVIDLVGGGHWFKHTGEGKYQAEKIDEYAMSRSAAGDLIKGGRPEVVLGSGDIVGPLNLYQWDGKKWAKTTLIETVDHGHTLAIADIDGDGNLDIFCAEMAKWSGGDNPDSKTWILFGDGRGRFQTEEMKQLEGTGNHESRLADLDGDGDLDILQKPFILNIPKVDIWLNGGTHEAKGEWLADDGYEWRLPIRVMPGFYARTNKCAEVRIDFTSIDKTGLFNEHALVLAEVDNRGTVIEEKVPFQFERAGDFDPKKNVAGTLTFFLQGETSSGQQRIFHLYRRGLGSSFSPGPFQQQVKVSDVEYQGEDSFKIETPTATYYYHKKGGGFASIIDPNGNDWISYHPGGESAGEYRGIPNLVHPEGYFHPGGEKCVSKLVANGPLKATIYSESLDGKWACKWDTFPTYARLTVLKAGHEYWFLYEGTPGGKLEEKKDVVMRPGEKTIHETAASVKWDGDIESVYGGEWIFFVDGPRSLYIVHHEDDYCVDSYWPMRGEMNVFGFGRKDLNKYMTRTPAHFTLGFVKNDTFLKVAAEVNAAWQPMTVWVGRVQERKSSRNTGQIWLYWPVRVLTFVRGC